MTDFSQLGLALQWVEQLAQHHITTPTPIQQQVIPEALLGNSLLATSQTGSGKTLAFLLPLLQRLEQQTANERALILAPTRELAIQIGKVCEVLCSGEKVSYTVITGGVPYGGQKEALSQQPQIIIATPGRWIDLMEQGVTQLEQVNYFVLDEVDQMLDLGFRDSILALAQLRHPKAVTLCFSATLPEKVHETLEVIAPSIALLEVQGQRLAVERIEQIGYYVEFKWMDALLLHLIQREKPQHAILFTRSRKMADRLAALLQAHQIAAEAIHAERSQAAREYILGRFASGETQILVATDVIARGIDLDHITHVFNFGLPQEAEQYVHRIGRTGRAGRSGKAISLCPPEEKNLVGEISKFMRQTLPMSTSHPYQSATLTLALQTPTQLSTSSSKKRKRKK